MAAERPRLASLRKALADRSRLEAERDQFSERFPDCGPLDIKDYNAYRRISKEIFYEKWSSPRLKSPSSLEDYVKLKLVGSGSFGFVALVSHTKSDKFYALKCVDKDQVIMQRQLENLKTEQLLLRCINHPLTIYSSDSFKDNSYIYFVMPFVEGGDLFSHLSLTGGERENNARFYACQVILALEYIHFLDFVYRDLKPENILMDRNGYLKLADFGFAKRLNHRLRTYTLCGTPEYLAPEIILNRGYGKAADWWAVGVFIYELVAGQTPFVSDNATMICEKIISRKFKFPTSFSPELRELIDKLLQVDLSRRYGNLKNGANDIKDHKWMLAINWMAVLNRKVEAPYKPALQPLTLEEASHWKLPKEGAVDRYQREFADF